MKKRTIKGYKFVNSNMTSFVGAARWRVGKWKKLPGMKPYVSLCHSGFHASKTPYQAHKASSFMGSWHSRQRLFVVEARGKIEYGLDKFVASEMRLVKELPIAKIIRKIEGDRHQYSGSWYDRSNISINRIVRSFEKSRSTNMKKKKR